MPRAGDLVDHLLDDVARRMLPEGRRQVFAQPVQPLGGGEALKITNRRRVPVEECLGLRRLRVPPLGEILALGRLIPDRPMDSTALLLRLDEIGHVADNRAQHVEFAVEDHSAHAVFIAPCGQCGDDHRNRGQRRIVREEVDVTVPLRDLYDTAQEALEARLFRERFDVRVECALDPRQSFSATAFGE